MLGDVSYGNHRSDGERLCGFTDTLQFGYTAQINHALWTGNALFDLGKKIGAASDQLVLAGGPSTQLDGLFYRPRFYVFKWMQ